MKCKCVKCNQQYVADVRLQEELTRFYLAHRRKPPAESPWICDKCWQTFSPDKSEAIEQN